MEEVFVLYVCCFVFIVAYVGEKYYFFFSEEESIWAGDSAIS
jgi:hypothetical protein